MDQEHQEQSIFTISSDNDSRDEREEGEEEELPHLSSFLLRLTTEKKKKKRLARQLSVCEVSWEKRRDRSKKQLEHQKMDEEIHEDEVITDEDLDELKGCIELGFGFKEEECDQNLCNTLPALDLYFAVNRQLSPSPVSSPLPSRKSTSSLEHRSSSFASFRNEPDTWKICSPGDDPEQVKTKLRHWAQAVACSMMQKSS